MTIKHYVVRDFLKNTYIRLTPRLKEQNLRLATMLGLTLSAISVLGVLAINPTLSTIAQLRKQLSDSQAVYASMKQKNTNLSVLQEKYRALENDLPLVFSALPREPSLAIMVAQLQTLLANHSLTASHIQVGEVELIKNTAVEKYASFTFTLAASGPKDSISAFVSSLVQFERIATIENMSIASLTDTNIQQISLSGRAYFKTQ